MNTTEYQQCTKVADMEYGWEIRCILTDGHEGVCEA